MMVASPKNEQDQDTGTESMSTMPTSSHIAQDVDESSFESKEQFASRDDYAPKVRKPYTITKQRERWTEDEHVKFVEALKLYGRAWKRIEEHVGTKTAIQIRSHAQKFFTKVVRESSATSVKPVEIPPPRPKRKPVHPYPRKLALSGKGIDQIAERPLRTASMSPCLSVLEHENRSPTSVLSAVDTSEANTPNGSLSPVSSATCVHISFSTHSVPNRSSSDQEDYSPNSEEEDADALQKLLLISKDNGLSKEGSVDASSSRCLKLFGKTMIVTDSHTESMKTVETPLQRWNSSESITSTRVYSPIPIKPCMMPNNQEAQDRDFRKEGSSSGSNTVSVCLEGDEDRKSVIEAQSQEISLDREMEHNYFLSRTGKACILKHRASIKGFVPYKRCVADKGFVPYSSLIREEGIEQRIRLSL